MAAVIASPKSSSFKSISWGTFILNDNGGKASWFADSNLLLSGSLSDKDFLSVPPVSLSAFWKLRHRRSSFPQVLKDCQHLYIPSIWGSKYSPFPLTPCQPRTVPQTFQHCLFILYNEVYWRVFLITDSRAVTYLQAASVPGLLATSLSHVQRAVSSVCWFLFIFKNGSVTYFQMTKLPSVTFLPSFKLSSSM